MRGHPDLLRAERSLLAAARRDRETVQAGALTACVQPGAGHPLMHVAIPSGPEPEDWAPSVRSLLALERQPSGVPRLEYMEELHPGLLPALENAGFRPRGRAPVLTASAAELAPAAPARADALTRVDLASASDPLLVAFLEAQAVAYGMPAMTGHAFLARLRSGLRSGATRATALLLADRPVCGATLQLGGPAAELAGVWTSPTLRRRGLAAEACAALLGAAARSGVDWFWLSSEPAIVELYRGLGFRPVGTQVDVDPPA